MELPRTDHDVPFNITARAMFVLTVNDLDASRLFYTR